MRQLFKLIILCALLMVVACEPGLVTLPTNTPGVNNPTPTSETWIPTPTQVIWPTNTPEPTAQPNWDMSCVEGNEPPLNRNPCLSPAGMGADSDMEWVVEPNGNYDGHSTEAVYDNGYLFPLAGVEGEGFAGFIGVELHGLVLEGGQCYGGFFPGSLNVNDMPPSQFTDVSFQAFILKDDGKIYPLNVHGITVVGTDGIRRVNDSPKPFWAFWVRNDETIIFRMGINQVHANARMGNYFRPSAAYVIPIAATNCPGAAT